MSEKDSKPETICTPSDDSEFLEINNHKYENESFLFFSVRVKRQHPISQPPHTSNSVQNCNLTDALTKCKALTYLDLRSNDIADGMSLFAEILSGCPVLTNLDLYSNVINNHGATNILIYCTTLTDINLEHNRIFNINHEALCASLTDLNLSDNYLDDKSDIELVFANCSALRYLNLAANHFEHVKCFITSLPKWPSLKELDLSNCFINDLGMIIFAEVLPKYTSLTHLDLLSSL